MTAQEKMKDLIEQMKRIRRSTETICYDHPLYEKFHTDITDFICENGLEDSNE